MDQELYQYLVEHLNEITDEWLKMRDEKNGSVYSKDANTDTVELLRKQNELTNMTVSSVLLEDKDKFNEQLEQWAVTVAHSRAESQTPIYEVLWALSKVREVYWRFVERFSNANNITVSAMGEWASKINSAFDQLNIDFAEKYYNLVTRRLVSQQNLISELSSPVIPISQSKGILPLIGDIDTLRAKLILETIPGKCMESQVDHLFIDLSGVSIIDTMVAHEIFQLIQVLGLLGVQATLTGIRPEIAQTSVQLGLNFSQIPTYSTLRLALENAEKEPVIL
ncbi:STAS domain-containing protein [Falsibacillus pallidus]|uniref:RsbT co-antagonist protein RsbR n=1 Tax=Falsibacillus pallidus TaxID=493781 RepID=A0A370GP56_9BACI|nr:STAS domain-containing protein [Falsibacillus pallidus]RDI45518.1 rsbT co-antagonist protein RsbR [Falsibacillus pallidus]